MITRHCHILLVCTIMRAPRLMCTLTKESLATFTLHAVQPDRSCTGLVIVVQRMTNISTENIKSLSVI